MNKSRISIIAAMDEKRGVGKGNELLFKIPEDFRRMKELTLGHPIVMGRKTYESIGRLLPGRTNIIVSRSPVNIIFPEGSNAAVVTSIEEGIEVAKKSPGGAASAPALASQGEIFIFGGGEIWRQALQKRLVDRLYLTLVEGDYNADTFFPEYPEFTKVISEEKRQADGYRYRFIILERV